jgi:uncharacterized membrane protein
MKKQLYLMAFLSILSGQKCFADLKVANHSGSIVFLAFGFIENGKHISKGWTTLNNGETKTLIAGDNLKQTYFYYAMGDNMVWKGTELFYINKKVQTPFSYNGQNQASTDVQIGFERVNLGTGNVTKYTIDLLGPENPRSRTNLQAAGRATYVIDPLITAPSGSHQSIEPNKR